MPIDWRQPDAREIASGKKAAMDVAYTQGLIGEDTYLVSLSVLRYSRDEALGYLYQLKLNRPTIGDEK